jgi:tetratricopeptide (TPR) repeat protein
MDGICSTTLVGSSRDIVADAIESVAAWVDHCLLVDTGADDGSIDVAVAAAGDKAVVREFTWCNDFSAARNFALDEATALGAAWSVTIDADERLLVGDLDIRGALGATTANCMLVVDAARTYAKERFFRIPTPARFVGPTHESFPSHEVGAEVLDGVRFAELSKDADAVVAKRERDVRILEAHTAAHPDAPRWWYYLGDALQGLGRLDDAIAAYDRCQALRGWPEEAAWACYRAAECEEGRGDNEAAVRWCALGLTHHPSIAELPWLAGVCSFRLGRLDDAIAWARQAEALGMFSGTGASMGRIGFRYPPALYEGPYDVLRFALAAIGDEAGAAQAEVAYESARVKRATASM